MKNDIVLLDHGSGGELSDRLVREVMLAAFDNADLRKMGDGAVLDFEGTRLAFSTDSYVVDPLFFPGGSIGDLAVNGTVNDLAMCGSVPLWLSAGMIIEEGFPVSDLQKIVQDMAVAADKAGVRIVTGDTKVVPKGAADKLFINTSGIGQVISDSDFSKGAAKPGDKIIVSGTIADHGMTILTCREGLQIDSDIHSDTAPLNRMAEKILSVSDKVSAFRDPTRGGLATVLNEIAGNSAAGIEIDESRIPVKKSVSGVCDLLGFDPLYVANEGKMVVFVSESDCNRVLDIMKDDPAGTDAVVIGDVTMENPGRVTMKTAIGGERILRRLAGDQLPRIC